jgi:rhamnosyltransferase
MLRTKGDFTDMRTKKPTVAVLIPTYRPDKKFSRLLQMLQHQTYPVEQLIIMNTEESLWNADGYKGIPGMEVHHVTRDTFDHGGTRRKGMNYVRTDICVCMTQDAVPADNNLIERLVQAILDEPSDVPSEYEPVACAYARQLPDKNCRVIERYTRSFNYPAESMMKSEADLERLGIKTYFCSNVCAAYNMEIYRRLDGFVERTIFNEDMLYAAQVIEAGYRIAYAADAKVVHSHNYTAMQQLHRNFDLAVSQAEHPEVFAKVKSESEGIRMVKQTARYLHSVHKEYLLPELVIQSGCKYLGYQLGRHYRLLPKSVIMKLTMSPYYWKNM